MPLFEALILGRMTVISDLPRDLVGEILSKVPLTSLKAVRSTCKEWKVLSQNQIFGKAATRKQFLGFMRMDCRVCSMKFDLQRNRNDDFIDPSVKQISILNQVEISKVIHCDGLLLCVIRDEWRLVVWNPYLGQTRRIQPRNHCNRFDMYALGYDNNRNHKILRILEDFDRENLLFRSEIYDFNSDSWRVVLDINSDLDIIFFKSNLSLNGNSYIFPNEKIIDIAKEVEGFLLCFDFTAERFGPRLPLPFSSYFGETVIVSCVREEHLAVLYEHNKVIEIWITTKIEPNALLWSKFLKVHITLLTGFPDDFEVGGFFIDEENKVAVVSDVDICERTETSAHIIGQDGSFKSVKIGEAPDPEKRKEGGYTRYPPVFSSYVPSLVQVQIKQRGKRKQRDY